MIKTNFEYKSFNFPGGEKQIRITNPEEIKNLKLIEFTWIYESDSELLELGLLVDAIRRIKEDKLITLNLPYVPYARQDRVCYPGEAFSLNVFCNILKTFNFNHIFVTDPHSEIISNYLYYLIVNNSWILKLEKKLIPNTLLIAPDKGAANKIKNYSKVLQCQYIICDKVRDTDTGYITSYSIPETDFSKYDCLLVIDDICDGGATFNILAENIIHANKWLFVTHGIFSKGTNQLLTNYNKIITTNSTVHAVREGIQVEVIDIL